VPASVNGLYVARLDIAQPHLAGVARKIEAQRKALADLGYPTRLLCLKDGAIVLDGEKIVPSQGSLSRRLNHHLRFHREMARAAWEANFVYIRFQGAPPDFNSALRAYKAARPQGKVVLELPSWPFATERRTRKQKLYGKLADSGLPSLHKNVDRIVTFSQAEEILGVSTLRTDNGVDVDPIPLASFDRTRDRPLQLCGVANLSFWHGYDRVIEGLARYRESEDSRQVQFTIVGSGEELPRLQAQVTKHRLEEMVRFTGPMHGEALDAILDQSDVGVSSIGMHRLDVDTSNIKSREFCARGLPFVIAYPDRDFPDELPFVKHLPASDEPVDIASVLAWFEELQKGTQNVPAVMREYAEIHLTWKAKLAPVADYLETQLRPAR